MSGYREGTDLILAVDGKALGYSTTCKVSTSAETGERKTKEQGSGKFKERYVKSISETVTAEGFEYEGSRLGYPGLKAMMLAGTPVDLTYGFLGDEETYGGKYVITSLDIDGPAGDDAKYSVTFENAGAVSLESGESLTREGVGNETPEQL